MPQGITLEITTMSRRRYYLRCVCALESLCKADVYCSVIQESRCASGPIVLTNSVW